MTKTWKQKVKPCPRLCTGGRLLDASVQPEAEARAEADGAQHAQRVCARAHSQVLAAIVMSANACTAVTCAVQVLKVEGSGVDLGPPLHADKQGLLKLLKPKGASMHVKAPLYDFAHFALVSRAPAACHVHWVREGPRTVHEGLRGGQRRADDLRIQVGQAALREVLHLPAVNAVEQAVDGEVAPARGSACDAASDMLYCKHSAEYPHSYRGC